MSDICIYSGLRLSFSLTKELTGQLLAKRPYPMASVSPVASGGPFGILAPGQENTLMPIFSAPSGIKLDDQVLGRRLLFPSNWKPLRLPTDSQPRDPGTVDIFPKLVKAYQKQGRPIGCVNEAMFIWDDQGKLVCLDREFAELMREWRIANGLIVGNSLADPRFSPEDLLAPSLASVSTDIRALHRLAYLYREGEHKVFNDALTSGDIRDYAQLAKYWKQADTEYVNKVLKLWVQQAPTKVAAAPPGNETAPSPAKSKSVPPPARREFPLNAMLLGAAAGGTAVALAAWLSNALSPTLNPFGSGDRDGSAGEYTPMEGSAQEAAAQPQGAPNQEASHHADHNNSPATPPSSNADEGSQPIEGSGATGAVAETNVGATSAYRYVCAEPDFGAMDPTGRIWTGETAQRINVRSFHNGSVVDSLPRDTEKPLLPVVSTIERRQESQPCQPVLDDSSDFCVTSSPSGGISWSAAALDELKLARCASWHVIVWPWDPADD